MKNFQLIFADIIEQVESQIPFKPNIALVLGSGLGNFANEVNKIKSIAMSDIKNYPSSEVQGHSNTIHFAEIGNLKLMILQGRIHFYEGYTISQALLPIYLSWHLGCNYLLLTNAAGGVNPNFSPGTLMLNTSFNGMFIKKELSQLIGLTRVENYSSLNIFPSKKLLELIRTSALEEKIDLKEGTYWYTKGPSYETPAEIRMIDKFYGDAVGMSTVHEAFVGFELGMEVAAISCITNFAAGLTNEKLSHTEVIETSNRVQDKFTRLLKQFLKQLSLQI